MMNDTVEYLKKRLPFTPRFAIILGTGLGALADEVVDKIEIPYEEIPGFVRSTAPSHHGALIAGYLNAECGSRNAEVESRNSGFRIPNSDFQVPVLVFKGRFHFYEGYNMSQVVYPVRIARLLGVEYLFVTNAAGSLNSEFKPGQLVRICDHINMMGTNPLIGSNALKEDVFVDGCLVKELGERFPSMHEPYDATIAGLAEEIARENNISLKKGVYCAVTGPNLETKAECLMIKGFGADLVGMSTVPEVIAAVHCGLKVFAVSVVTNLSNIFHSEPHSQEEIRENADKASKDLLKLIKGVLRAIDN